MPLRSDPGRLPRRNHYQEGPGVPVPGNPGRPAARGWRHSEHRERGPSPGRGTLRRWHQGDPATQVAAELGIGRATPYRWQGSFQNAEEPCAGRHILVPM